MRWTLIITITIRYRVFHPIPYFLSHLGGIHV
nr:MAG TPA: hypothetical protein [Myoviridae sp. ctNPX13]